MGAPNQVRGPACSPIPRLLPCLHATSSRCYSGASLQLPSENKEHFNGPLGFADIATIAPYN